MRSRDRSGADTELEMNRKILSWAGYDFANTMFSMNVVSRYFPIFAINTLGGSDLSVGIARSSAMVLVAFTMPVLGALADRHNRRKQPLVIFTLICCLLTIMLGATGNLTISLAFFGSAIFCYEAALVYYNALLPAVAPPDKLAFISGLGVSLGYCGSITGLFLVATLNRVIDFPYFWTALLFFLFSIPTFVWVKDYDNSGIKTAASDSATLGLAASLRRAGRIPGMIRLLVGRFFIIEAVETIILFMAVYLINAAGMGDRTIGGVGLDEVTFFLIVVTFFTAVGSLIWGFFTQKYGARIMLIASAVFWMIALAGIVVFPGRGVLFVWGLIAGCALGGFWTAERPLLIGLVNDDKKLGEYFGLFSLSGRMAAVIGPIIWGAIIYALQSLGAIKYRIAVGAMFLMVTAGTIILLKVPDPRKTANGSKT